MNSNKSNRSIPFLRYFPASIKFYGLKNDKIAAMVFIILLVINFLINYFAVNNTPNFALSDSLSISTVEITQALGLLVRIAVVGLVSLLIMNVFSSFYIYAFMRDLRGIPYTFAGCLKDTAKKLFRIIILSIIVSLAVFTGSLLFAIPGLILYIMFIFGNQFLLDQNKSVFNALKSSVNLTSGYKMGIFFSVFLLNLIIMVFPSFVESGNGLLVFSFVSAFISTIFILIYHRFVTLIYFDLEYIRKPRSIDINV